MDDCLGPMAQPLATETQSHVVLHVPQGELQHAVLRRLQRMHSASKGFEVKKPPEFFEMTVSAEWVPGQKAVIRTWLDHIRFVRAQVQHYIDRGLPPSVERAQRDVQGYDEVINSGSEWNAYNFQTEKFTRREGGTPFEDNLAVVAHLKDIGKWEAS